MRGRNIDLAFGLSLAVAIFAASPAVAQSTDGGKSKKATASKSTSLKPVAAKPADSVQQKSPESKPAPRVAQNKQQPNNKKDQSPVKPKKDGKAEGNKAGGDKAAKSDAPKISKERRAELMAFVKANHPELQPLLNQLKSKQEKRFQSVLLTLDADVKRLQRWEKNSPTRYKRGLQQWVINSRVQLLKAQLSLKKNGKERAAIRKKIRAEFEKEHKLHRENTVIAIEAAKKKHERLKQILKDHDANRDSKIERKLAELERSSSQHKKKPEEKSGDKDNSAKGNPNKKQAAAEASKPKHNGKQNAKSAEKAKPTPNAEPVQDSKPAQKNKPAEKTKPANSPKDDKAKAK